MKPFKTVTRLCMGLAALACMATSCNGQNKSDEPEVVLETTLGEIRVRLYNDTPLHRDRFLQNVRNGLYDGKTWHRIIRNFMIQTGEQPARIDANGDTLQIDTADMIPAEIRYPQHFNRRGVLAAAREGDDVNPNRKSDPTQFYIVTGRAYQDDALRELDAARTQQAATRLYNQKVAANAEKLEALRKARNTQGLSNMLEKLLDEAKYETSKNPPAPFNEEQKRAYRINGGAPWLDGEYTVFGEVVEGMKTVLAIEKVKTDANDRPLTEVKITKAYIVE